MNNHVVIYYFHDVIILFQDVIIYFHVVKIEKNTNTNQFL